MKTYSLTNCSKVTFAGILFMLIAVSSFSQSTNYNCYLKNITQVDPKTITVEVWLENTGSNTLQLEGFQGGIDFNYAGLANGGTITGTFVAGSASALPVSQQSPFWEINSTSKQIRMCATIASAPTLVPAAPGFRLGTLRMVNTVNFASVTPNFVWSFTDGTGYTTQTFVDCFVSGNNLGEDVTIPANHQVSGNPIINANSTVPTLSEWGLITMSVLFLSFGLFYLKPKSS